MHTCHGLQGVCIYTGVSSVNQTWLWSDYKAHYQSVLDLYYEDVVNVYHNINEMAFGVKLISASHKHNEAESNAVTECSGAGLPTSCLQNAFICSVHTKDWLYFLCLISLKQLGHTNELHVLECVLCFQ